MGMFRMGISRDQSADLIANLVARCMTVKLAASSQILCRFRFDDQALSSPSLADKGKTSAISSAHAHSAILMASQPVEGQVR